MQSFKAPVHVLNCQRQPYYYTQLQEKGGTEETIKQIKEAVGSFGTQ